MMCLLNCLLESHVYTHTQHRGQLWSETFLLQGSVVTAETHNWPKCWEQVTAECPVRSGTTITPSLRLREHSGRRTRKTLRRQRKLAANGALISRNDMFCHLELKTTVVIASRLGLSIHFHGRRKGSWDPPLHENIYI